MLKCVIFDMDGVIIDSEPLHRKAFYKMFEELGISVAPTLYETYTGMATLPICKELCEKFELSKSPETLVALKRKHFYDLFNNDPNFELIEGVLDLIKHYHQLGLKLILASSASMPNIEFIFNRFDLNEYFAAKLSGADLKASKPHPEIFINAAKISGFSNEECMVIEDSTNGMKAAQSAGIFCVGYKSAHSKNQDYDQADFVIEDFKEIEYPILSTFFL
ncbi:MAG: HAD family phosphatase [Flavobacteriaceae bacterium]